MKHLALASTALFLLAAPGAGFAQSADTTASGSASGTTTIDSSGNTTVSTPNATGGESQCNDETAASGYDSFSEKCRHQIDAWAAAQAGAGAKVEGDVAVGVVVPDSVEIVEVPAYHDYGYVTLNEHRVLVDRNTRKVIHVY